MSDALSRIDALIAGLREQEAPPAPPKKEPEKKDEPEKKEPEKKEAKMTRDARDFISKKISILRKEGYPQKQAIAIAHQMAADAGFDIPPAPKEEADVVAFLKDLGVDEEEEPEKKPEPEGEPEKKDDEEMEEGCGFTKRQFEMAKAEMASFDRFLDKYQDGDNSAFKSVVVEGDDPLMARMREVPPQKWFEGCVRSVSEDTSVDDPAALCSWMWWHHMTAEQRKRVRENQE